MCPQMDRLNRCIVALVAFVRLFSRVSFHMFPKGRRQKMYFLVRLTERGGEKVKIARDKSARRTSSYAGSSLIQEGFG